MSIKKVTNDNMKIHSYVELHDKSSLFDRTSIAYLIYFFNQGIFNLCQT